MGARAFIGLVAVAAGMFGSVPAANAQGCVNKLPVQARFGSEYALAYKGQSMNIRLVSEGPRIKNVKAELYTFGGDLIAQSPLDKKGFRSSKLLKMKLRYGPMQSGKYTLVVTGEPNKSSSCGPKKSQKVVTFRDCPKTLPIQFPDAPGGKASDYGHYLSFRLRSTAGVLRNLDIELYDFSNNLFARGKLRALYGTAWVNLKLRHMLVDGGYTLIVSGTGVLPKACGDKTAEKVLQFGAKPGGTTAPTQGQEQTQTTQPDEELPPDEDTSGSETDGTEA